MAARRPMLSKSRLISAWQCPRRLHLEKHHPEYGVVSSQTESLFATGHRVGEIAQRLYGTPASVEIEFDKRTGLMVHRTHALIDNGADYPIFEATFRYEGVLVRADVLIPDGAGWRIIEVKASTSVKDYHVLDCAIQDWVLRNSGIDVTRISLAHINNQFIYPGDDDYDGLLVEHDLTDGVRTLEPTVLELVGEAREAVTGPMPHVDVGTRCSSPYDCQFTNYCWPTDSDYPIAGLGGGKARLGEYVALGYRDICDVPSEAISAETQQRIHRVTCSGRPEVLGGAREAFESLPFPRYYLDFETIGPAVPFWPGTRPYAPVAVQWSCHIEESPGEFRHEEFLDLSGDPPMRPLAEALIDVLGDIGPVLMWTGYEATVIRNLGDLFPDLDAALGRIADRLYDMHPVVKQNYYHPKMLGSWSIKAVMPTISPDMDYAKLEGIREGTAASDGFIEAIGPETSPERKAELEAELRRYCRFDTEAMVEVLRFFTDGDPA
jgi:hypothetical protein